MTLKITSANVFDVRYPTSDKMLGSDPFHRKPDYSCAYLRLQTSDPKIQGVSLVFTIGAGTDWVVYGIRDLVQLLVGMSVSDFTSAPGKVHERLLNHHQARWLGDAGVFSMSVGAVVNALWDIVAKEKAVPMWQYLAELPSETLVSCVNWRHLKDALTPNEAMSILNTGMLRVAQGVKEFTVKGPEAYSTAAWSGLTEAQLRESLGTAQRLGMRSVKAKVGMDFKTDVQRLELIRKIIGESMDLRVDANQIWGVEEAIEWMTGLARFRPLWIEEPTHPDDVFGYLQIKEALRPHGIGVACGEHTKNPILFKQLLKSGAIDFCQIDASRMAGVNDVLAVLLLARKFNVPVCPHGGGIGLCNFIQHYGAFDQLRIAGSRENRVVEWIDFLNEAMMYPVAIQDGCYVLPSVPGWGAELLPEFVEQYSFPSGPIWKERAAELTGLRFEA